MSTGGGTTIWSQNREAETEHHIMAAIDEFQRELIVEGTYEGLVAADDPGWLRLSPGESRTTFHGPLPFG